MHKNDFQLCMLQANQLSMLNYQKLTCLMNANSNFTPGSTPNKYDDMPLQIIQTNQNQ
jgi:hypothetical protein